MDWRIKVAGHWAVSAVPALGYTVQRHITRSLPRREASFAAHVRAAELHLALATQHFGRPPQTAYEFGGGWDLIVPMTLARHIPSQTVSDVARLARPELIADTARRLGVRAGPAALGIRYIAPVDAGCTGLAAGSFDLVHSTDTLEHVPIGKLSPLFVECRRLLRPGGVFTALVDYTDHYSHADESLPTFNFLRYSDRVWRLFNPTSHYQSRIRHADLLQVLAASGFDVRETRPTMMGTEVASAWIVAVSA